jgi:hypothetical protein
MSTGHVLLLNGLGVVITGGGAGVYPAEDDVWHGTGDYGPTGTEYTPEMVGSDITNLAAGNIKSGTTIDNVTGTYDPIANPTFPSANETLGPIVERIMGALKTKLEGITIAAGYQQTVSSVVRPTRLGGFTPADRMIVLSQKGMAAEDSESAIGHTARMLKVEVRCILRTSEAETTPIDTRTNKFSADVEKILLVDESLGGLADWIDVDDVEIQDPGDDFAGCTVNLTIGYRTLRTYPYSRG